MTRTLGSTIAVALIAGCGQTNLDAGSDSPHGPLPVDERSPMILSNDGARDNWQGEYAMVLASAGQITLAGIIVNASAFYPSLDTNLLGWQAMVDAARASGMRNIPDPTPSAGPSLARPADGNLDSTLPIRSAGAQLIVETAHRLSRPHHPLVIATGGRLTELADAYLVDRTVTDLVVVVASLGHPSPDGQSAVADTNHSIANPRKHAFHIAPFSFRIKDSLYETPHRETEQAKSNNSKEKLSERLAINGLKGTGLVSGRATLPNG